jgi:uncharacterized repeat protein (TIGR01451 family)
LLAGALAGALLAPAAAADVTLSTRVEKVESILDASGNVQRRLISAQGVLPGEELRYTITVSNDSEMLVSEGRVVVTNPIPDGTAYLPGTAGGADCLIEVSGDGETFAEEGADLLLTAAEGSLPAEGSLSAEGSLPAEGSAAGGAGASSPSGARVSDIRWTLERDLEPGATHDVFFHVRMEAGGAP